ncbi:MAG TPA: glycosyltransferase family 2 protein [Candidatus Dormibacteraeota bacterium]|nr:glycosyltransferase family 2 protein [Candidatus Dormibacteraeota bacterium]
MRSALTPVTVLIVTHNSSRTVQQTLEPLRGADLEVIVVDNASTDSTAEMVAGHDGVRLVRSDDNLGFGRGSNLAASHATRELLLLLNPDCVASTEAIATLAARLLDEPRLGFVGPQIQKESGEPDYASLRGDPDPVGALLYVTRVTRLFPNSPRINRYNLTHLDYDREQELLNGTAGCLMVRASAFHEVGGFDAEFFMYGEDLDLCRRLREAGHPGRYVPAARVLHVKGESTRQRSGQMLVEFHRAMWVYYRKHEAASRPAVVNLAVRAGITALGVTRLAANALRRDKRVSTR